MARRRRKDAGMEKFGSWAFIIGVIIAILSAFINIPAVGLILVLLGLIVGILNVTASESTSFLVATIALLAAGSAGLAVIPALGTLLESILGNIIAFVAPAALVVSLKSVYELAAKK